VSARAHALAGPRATGPHAGQPVLAAGTPLDEAAAAVVLVHGRGAGAENMLALADALERPRLAYLAPQASGAAGYAWYPQGFMAPIAANEPGLSSGLAVLGELVERLQAAGIPPERTALLGFSQGACLALEFAARNARRYGAVIGFSGGLIGPPGTPRDYPGTLAGTPVFLGCSDRDPHIPKPRVDETAEVLAAMGGQVTKRIYPHMAHTVNADEIDFAQRMLDELVG
jgi:phospholipase/carboxylesterase